MLAVTDEEDNIVKGTVVLVERLSDIYDLDAHIQFSRRRLVGLVQYVRFNSCRLSFRASGLSQKARLVARGYSVKCISLHTEAEDNASPQNN